MMGEDGPVVYLLCSGTTFEDYQRIADIYGWRVVRASPGDGRLTPFEQVRVTSDGSTAIHYLSDPIPKERFLYIHGPRVGEIAFNVGRSFYTESSEEVLERARTAVSDDDKHAVAYQLAVVFLKFDQEVMNLLEQFYAGGSISVRYAVINAIGYRGWTEARDFLERVAREEPDETLRKNARSICVALWGVGPEKQSSGLAT
jgi:hypothetical protein